MCFMLYSFTNIGNCVHTFLPACWLLPVPSCPTYSVSPSPLLLRRQRFGLVTAVRLGMFLVALSHFLHTHGLRAGQEAAKKGIGFIEMISRRKRTTEKLSDGSFFVRSKRMEAKAVQLYNQSEERAKIMKLLETAAEPEVLMAGMSSKQLTHFTSYKAKLEAMRQSDMQNSIEKAIEAAGLNKRDVTPFMRVKVIGLTDKFHPKEGGQQQGLITIWNPTQKENIGTLRNSTGTTVVVHSPNQQPPFASAHESD